MPTSASPALTFEPSMSFDFSTTPTVKPAMSYSPSAYMPGISAVSPPTSAHPAWRQPSATPATMASIFWGSLRPTAT